MASRGVMRNMLLCVLVLFFSAVFLDTAEGSVNGSCPADQIQCRSGKCIRRSWYCDGHNDCRDNIDERYCDWEFSGVDCPSSWMACGNGRRCFPASWKCDGIEDCPDRSDESGCQSGVRSVAGVIDTERMLLQMFMNTRQQATRSINKWDAHITKTAVALFLNNRRFFAPGNKTGVEIAYELSLKLLSKLALKKEIPTKELTLFINALTVACIDPKDFFGVNMVQELRKRVNNSKETNPFSILTLCNAKDTMTEGDVVKLQQRYNAHYGPLWTDTQAIAVMALSCISSRSDVNLEEGIYEMVSELKKKQHKNGTIHNLKTTALVVQALFAAGSSETDFDLDAAIKSIVKEDRRHSISKQDGFYILPIFNSMSLANINSDHCVSPVKTDREVINNLREELHKRIQVHVSLFVGDDMNISRTWKIKVPTNYSFFQVLENIGTLEPAYKVQYAISKGKPYVTGVGEFQDDSQEGSFWFIYSKPLSSIDDPKRIEESPVDIQVKETEEFILWYRTGFWEDA